MVLYETYIHSKSPGIHSHKATSLNMDLHRSAVTPRVTHLWVSLKTEEASGALQHATRGHCQVKCTLAVFPLTCFFRVFVRLTLLYKWSEISSRTHFTSKTLQTKEQGTLAWAGYTASGPSVIWKATAGATCPHEGSKVKSTDSRRPRTGFGTDQ